VDSSGGHCKSTLILNEKAEIIYLDNYINTEVDIRFLKFLVIISNI
jgi:hypothetical protein